MLSVFYIAWGGGKGGIGGQCYKCFTLHLCVCVCVCVCGGGGMWWWEGPLVVNHVNSFVSVLHCICVCVCVCVCVLGGLRL